MTRDRDTLGASAGIGGILARDAWSFFAKQIGFAKFYIWGLSADIFLPESQIQTGLGAIIGLLADTVMAALIGMAYVRFLEKRDDRDPILKGLGFGLGAWLLLFGILLHTRPGVTKAPSDPPSILSAFVGHSIFGLVLGLIWLWLRRFTDSGAERGE